MRTRSDTSMTLAGGGLDVFVSAWSAVLSILAEDPLYLACVFPSSVLASLHYWDLLSSALLSSSPTCSRPCLWGSRESEGRLVRRNGRVVWFD